MKIAIGLAAAGLLGGATIAQDMSGHDMSGHDMSNMQMAAAPASSALHETGQSAFAAIAEATAALEANPNTDWSKANIDELRNHLVDMDNVTLHADVARTDIPGGARFVITSPDPRVRDSINRMTRLHASMANKEGPYRLAPGAIPDGTALTITAPDAAGQTKIRALGFFGLLTEGVHHQLHHSMLAKGEPMNH